MKLLFFLVANAELIFVEKRTYWMHVCRRCIVALLIFSQYNTILNVADFIQVTLWPSTSGGANYTRYAFVLIFILNSNFQTDGSNKLLTIMVFNSSYKEAVVCMNLSGRWHPKLINCRVQKKF